MILYDARFLILVIFILFAVFFIIAFIISVFIASKIDSIRDIVNKIKPNTLFEDKPKPYKDQSDIEKLTRGTEIAAAGVPFDSFYKMGLGGFRSNTWDETKRIVFNSVNIDMFDDARLKKQIRQLQAGYSFYRWFQKIWGIISAVIIIFIIYKINF